VPAAVRDAFNRDHAGMKVHAVKKEVEKDGAVHYEFKYTDANGKNAEAEYDAMGNAAKEE